MERIQRVVKERERRGCVDEESDRVIERERLVPGWEELRCEL